MNMPVLSQKMSDSLFHRGPDDLNQWASLENDIFLLIQDCQY